ncbi:AraC family transcriptional regulator [Solirubrobacter phytolaccae]|uniref:AraC family transcriptional regulator n=1 Tax=Solirubrobacter phytolaccae TaxID=1404360 RepID=A0A9X3SB84_9ACTN|nr:AraC family transcriptional regulator [Solirubrobacter phytolaccae]MDA0185329.1 AraC family transcriptional regulator [Solirubrobacter phytolaccae]
MDPLSDVVSLLRVRGALASRLEAGGDWALRFSGYRHIKFGVVQAGTCWVMDQELQAGDCYLLTSGTPYTLAAHPGLQAEDGDARFRRAAREGVLRISAEPDLILDGGSLVFEEPDAELLLSVLPPFLRVRDDPDCAATIALLARETDASRPGADLTREHLAQVLFVQMLRAARPEGPSWLGALADPQIGAALEHIHSDPSHPWRVAELADAVHMSRSAFAGRFTRLVGSSPAEYAQHWRLHRAAAALRRPGARVTTVARDHGYASHASFSKAYKAVIGEPPSATRG